MVALRIAQEKAPHTIAEKLILPCCKDIVRCLIEDDGENVPLSIDTVQRRICDIAEDIEQQVVTEIRGAPLNKFAIQLDESTDVSNCVQLLVFARYVKDGDVIVWNPLQRGEDVFTEVSEYFVSRRLSWNNVSACTTDGAPAMLGKIVQDFGH